MPNNNILIVGLGNPGPKYLNTRHNLGFLALDAFAKEYGFPEFIPSKKHHALISEGFLPPRKELLPRRKYVKVVLAKPQTFMNNSGKAVASLVSLPKASCAQLALGKEYKELIVVHDDIDIPLGKVKVSNARGSAGHKGVDSIINALGTKNFTRIRVGIQPEAGKPQRVEDFVLKKLSKTELPRLQSAIQQVTETIISLVRPKGS